jgi:repressor LexA
MREEGVLEYSGHRNIITRRKQLSVSASVKVPILGAVSCGLPNFAVENIEEYVQLPVALFGQGPFFLLRAFGESMIEAGIQDGDLVLVRQQDYANAGQIVVALIGNDEATLKRYYPEPEHNRICLHPENSTMEDIYVSNCAIQGIAVKVLKDLM